MDDEGAIYFADAILDSLEEENILYTVCGRQHGQALPESSLACVPVCIVSGRRTHLTHLRLRHKRDNQYACSGTEQIKIILSLHNADCACRNMEFGYYVYIYIYTVYINVYLHKRVSSGIYI